MGKGLKLHWEVVLFWEGPLLEVPLYYHIRINYVRPQVDIRNLGPIKDTPKEATKDNLKVPLYIHSIQNNLQKRTTSLQRTKRCPKCVHYSDVSLYNFGKALTFRNYNKN